MCVVLNGALRSRPRDTESCMILSTSSQLSFSCSTTAKRLASCNQSITNDSKSGVNLDPGLAHGTGDWSNLARDSPPASLSRPTGSDTDRYRGDATAEPDDRIAGKPDRTPGKEAISLSIPHGPRPLGLIYSTPPRRRTRVCAGRGSAHKVRGLSWRQGYPGDSFIPIAFQPNPGESFLGPTP